MMAALRSAVGGAQVTVLEDSRDDVKRYLTYLTSGVTDEAVIDRFIDTAPSVVDFIEDHPALRFYVDCERPDYKTAFPGAADAGRLVAPKLYQLSRLGDLRPRLRQPDWEARTRPGVSGRGMEVVELPKQVMPYTQLHFNVMRGWGSGRARCWPGRSA
jgi:hypothetical protein